MVVSRIEHDEDRTVATLDGECFLHRHFVKPGCTYVAGCALSHFIDVRGDDAPDVICWTGELDNAKLLCPPSVEDVALAREGTVTLKVTIVPDPHQSRRIPACVIVTVLVDEGNIGQLRVRCPKHAARQWRGSYGRRKCGLTVNFNFDMSPTRVSRHTAAISPNDMTPGSEVIALMNQ